MTKRVLIPVVSLLIAFLCAHPSLVPMVGASLRSDSGHAAGGGTARSGNGHHTSGHSRSRKRSSRKQTGSSRANTSLSHNRSTGQASSPSSVGSCQQAPSSIASDGSVDVTAQMNSFFGSVPDNSCITFPPDASYWMEGTLLISGRTGLTVKGNGALFFAKYPGQLPYKPTPYRQHLRIVSSTSITISNLQIRGPNTTCDFARTYHAFEHGVLVGGSTNVSLNELTISQTDGDGIMIGDNSANPSRDVSVRGGSIDCTGRQGVSIIDADGVSVSGVSIDQAPRSAFDLEPDSPSQTISNVTLEYNTIGSVGNLFLAAGGPGVERDVTVRGNVLTGMPMKVKIGNSRGVVDRFDFTLTGNRSHVLYSWTACCPVAAKGVSGLHLIGNTQSFGTKGFWLNLTNTCDVLAANNTAVGAQGLWSQTSGSCSWVDGGGNVF